VRNGDHASSALTLTENAEIPRSLAMDPVLTGITIGGFLKDLVELGRDIKDSVEKVRENKERLSNLRDDVDETLYGLAKLTEGYEDAHPSPELYRALEGLKRSILLFIVVDCQLHYYFTQSFVKYT